ncbi:acetyl-CoA C-acetyltransferase [Natranaerofaba carboxydovora]|uniref:acetyl-CoA C-acetyltransferase n=1 Tax=Natranaerofaba carboxydovora TaxID=2742683 RepID=UPI001F12F820|nr:acetyl-CoA C-acetyltransferase [Natranaerofaba carboxydovora]UMZ74616.1 Acetyl-CoA acetyltransferase [Natranaerofaba carboxydovora]
MAELQETVIVEGARTPFGAFGGGLSGLAAPELGAAALEEAAKRAGIDKEKVENVIMGQVVQAGTGQIPSRQATLKAGFSEKVPSDTLNKVCAAGLRAVNYADVMIKAGEAEIVMAGGMENMSKAPYLMESARFGQRMGHTKFIDGMINDGLWCPVHDVHMGVHGSKVPRDEYGIDRDSQDKWALRSHEKAVEAMEKGYISEEIVPVEVKGKKGKVETVEKDECPRPDTNLEKLAKLPPAFEKDGTVTPGNAPPISDGASALVLMSKKKADELGLKPIAKIVSQGMASEKPPYISTVPALAANKAFEKTNLKTDDIDLIEVNEAFASVALTSIEIGKWDPEKVNVNGGAVALGHPIGASGGRILLTLLYEMQRRDVELGLATICSGAAQGEATIVQRI